MSKKLQLLLSVIIGIVVLILVFSTTVPREKLTAVEKIWRDVIFPFQKAFSTVGTALTNSWEYLTSLKSAASEVIRLEEELKKVQLEIEKLTEVRLENERLKDLVGFKNDSDATLVPAKVIGRDPRAWLNTILIDKGDKNGVTEGTPIVTYSGVVGHVTFTSAFTSQVTLLVDPKTALGGIIQRTRDFVIVDKANSNGLLKVTPLYQKEEGDSSITSSIIDFQEGDLVITSGFGGVYPKGLNIGVITNVIRGPEGITGTLRPSVDFSRLEEVFILFTPLVTEEASL
ncbi:MAG: rod shape-determining protein MreC [Firmicutes bacterium]|nr:rod shape-determining protein MreC [Bacillota bacterium]